MRRYVVLAGAAAAAVVLACSGLAWACSNQAAITVAPGKGRAGSQATVSGTTWKAAVPVELHWDGAGGAFLGSGSPAPNGAFTTPIAVPASASEGVHIIYAYQGPALGDANPLVASASFQVTPDAVSTDHTPQDDRLAGSGDGGAAATGDTANSSAGAGNAGGTGPGSARQGAEIPGRPDAASQPGTEAHGVAPAANPASQADTATAAAARSRAAASSLPAALSLDERRSASPQVAQVAQTPAGAGVSRASANADLWSGFGEGGQAATSLYGSLDDPAAGTAPGGPVRVAGVGLLVLGGGLVAMCTGFGLAEVARRRAAAVRVAD